MSFTEWAPKFCVFKQHAVLLPPMMQEEFAELREALAEARKEASSAQAAAAAELQTVRRQHKAAVQVTVTSTDHKHLTAFAQKANSTCCAQHRLAMLCTQRS